MSKNLKETVARGSYSIPHEEHEILENLVTKFPLIKPPLNKSELIRIGIHEVSELKQSQVKDRLDKIGRLKVGKPKKVQVQDTQDLTEISPETLKINEKQWREIKRILPLKRKKRGKPEEDARSVIEGILFIFAFEAQRRKMPPELPSFSTCRRRLRDWQRSELWKGICRILIDFSETSQKNLQANAVLRTLLIDTKGWIIITLMLYQYSVYL